jgi:outer membrane biosynthesis protein TonB
MKRSRPTTLEPISASMFLIVTLHVALAGGLWWCWRDYSASLKEPRLSWMKPADFKSATLVPVPASSPVVVLVTNESKAKPLPAAKPTPQAVKEEPVQKAVLVAAPPEPPRMEPVPNTIGAPLFAPATPAPKPSANRSITLRRVFEKTRPATAPGAPAPPMSSPTLLDIARLNTLRTAPVVAAPGVAPTDESINLDAVDEALNAAFLTHWTAPPIAVVPAAQREARLNISIGRDGTVLKSQMSKFSGSHDLDQSIIQAAAQVKKISVTLPSTFSKESYDLELNFLLLP